MKIKTCTLSGEALHFAVAIAEGWQDFEEEDRVFSWHRSKGPAWLTLETFRPSELWEQGGLILERERLQVSPVWREPGKGWTAHFHDELFGEDEADFIQCGPTPLIAAMRCYVASTLGKEVDIPDAMTGG